MPKKKAGKPRKPKKAKRPAGKKLKVVGKETALAEFAKLARQYPDAHCELDHQSAFELLVATVLSAQTTDVLVNKATPALFAKYPDAKALAAAEPIDLEPYTSTLGFFRQKAKSIVMLARSIVAQHGGEVPNTLDELVKLRGVGRKTANVVLGAWFHAPEGVVVDTHVQRLSQRLGWTKHQEPEDIEKDLMALLPQAEWDRVSHVLIWHGRRCCFAQKPACDKCPANTLCPSAFKAENIGRKPKRPTPLRASTRLGWSATMPRRHGATKEWLGSNQPLLLRGVVASWRSLLSAFELQSQRPGSRPVEARLHLERRVRDDVVDRDRRLPHRVVRLDVDVGRADHEGR